MFVRIVTRGLGVCGVVLAAAGCMYAGAQDLPLTQTLTMSHVSPLDPSRGVTAPVMESKIHTPLPEQYVWTATEKKSGKLVYKFPAITAETEPHYFRAHFRVGRYAARGDAVYRGAARQFRCG